MKSPIALIYPVYIQYAPHKGCDHPRWYKRYMVKNKKYAQDQSPCKFQHLFVIHDKPNVIFSFVSLVCHRECRSVDL